MALVYCNFCNASFELLTDLFTHFDAKKHWPCAECERDSLEFPSLDAVKKHIKETHGFEGEEVHCKKCNANCIYMELLPFHLKKYHPIERKVDCYYCDQTFSSKKDCIEHNKNSHPRCFVCIGSHPFATKEQLYVHLANFHPRRKCKSCDMSFETLDALKDHYKEAHPCCFICSLKFDSRDMLVKHLKHTHPICYTCGTKFQTVEQWKMHTKKCTSSS